MGCQCPPVNPPTLPPGSCQAKAVRLIAFRSAGEDSRVVDEWDGTSRNSQCPGNICPIELRWTVLDNIPHYPANVERCGPDAAVSGEPRNLNDGERYCQMIFGDTLQTSDATPRLIRNNNSPMAFRMFESDNQSPTDTSTTVPFVPFQVDGYFEPSQWFSETCSIYQLEYYESYANGDPDGSGQSIAPYLCYRTPDDSVLRLTIPRCRVNNLPTNNFYMFKFEILNNQL